MREELRETRAFAEDEAGRRETKGETKGAKKTGVLKESIRVKYIISPLSPQRSPPRRRRALRGGARRAGGRVVGARDGTSPTRS